MSKHRATTPEGVEYEYYRCKCGEEILDMSQLHDVAEKYRQIKKRYAKLSKWGQSTGLRIPKAVLEKYGLTSNMEVAIIDEKDGFKVVPA